jgi:hypothetical protein
MTTQISLERIRELQAEIDQINRLHIADVVITKNGKPLDVSPRILNDMRLTGLNTFGLLKDLDKQNP